MEREDEHARAGTAKLRNRILIAVLAAAALIRLVYFLQLASGPCVWQHRWDQSDMNFFDLWARGIADGDWLSDQALHPMHRWQREVAEAYLRADPEPEWLGKNTGDQPRDVWNHWFGGKRFHQEPLYPYLIAAAYGLFGTDVRWVFAWQMLFGLASIVLLFFIARRYFGIAAAAVAGTLAALCGPLLFYEMVLLRSTLIVFCGLGLVFLAERAFSRERARDWLWLGLGMGLALLLKTVFLLFALGIAAGMVIRYRARIKTMLGFSGAFAGGAVLCLIPAMARNLAVGVPLLGLSSVGAVTFINSNAVDCRPDLGFDVSEHMPRIMGETEGSFPSSVVQTLATHPGPGSFLAQQWGKLASIWHSYELPNNANFHYYSLHAPVLSVLPVTFLLVGPLGLVGLLLAAGRFRKHWLLFLLAACSLTSPLAFVPLSRHRLPLMAALIPFAALAAVQIAGWLRSRRFVPGIGASAAVLLMALSMYRSPPGGLDEIRVSDHIAAHEAFYRPLEQQAAGAKDWQGAAEILTRFLRFEPEAIGPSDRARSKNECLMAEVFGQVRSRAGHWLDLAGRPDQAAAHKKRAEELFQVSGRCVSLELK